MREMNKSTSGEFLRKETDMLKLRLCAKGLCSCRGDIVDMSYLKDENSCSPSGEFDPMLSEGAAEGV